MNYNVANTKKQRGRFLYLIVLPLNVVCGKKVPNVYNVGIYNKYLVVFCVCNIIPREMRNEILPRILGYKPRRCVFRTLFPGYAANKEKNLI